MDMDGWIMECSINNVEAIKSIKHFRGLIVWANIKGTFIFIHLLPNSNLLDIVMMTKILRIRCQTRSMLMTKTNPISWFWVFLFFKKFVGLNFYVLAIITMVLFSTLKLILLSW